MSSVRTFCVAAVVCVVANVAAAARAAPSSVSFVVSTAGSKLASQPNLTWTTDDGSPFPAVTVHAGTEQQLIEGFGTSFTGSSAFLLMKQLSPARRQRALTDLFSPSAGNGYTLARTHINSNDFSYSEPDTGPYSYDDGTGDVELTYFSVEHDQRELIPLIREAQAIPGAGFRLIASPWSAPAWMKDSEKMRGGGLLLVQFYDAWAKYFLKYLDAYAMNGIDVWGVTAQNEPYYDPASSGSEQYTWEGMGYVSVDELTYFIERLGTILGEGGHGDVKILTGDDQKDRLLTFAESARANPDALRHIWGMGTHWYVGDRFEQLDEATLRYSKLPILSTEATVYKRPLDTTAWRNDDQWPRALQYAHDIIGDINNGAAGWIDWNMALNIDGGPWPAPIKNPCSSQVLVNGGDYTLNAQYYALGHFSRYVRPGARKVGSISRGDVLVQASAFKNSDGRIVVVVHNAATDSRQIKVRDGQHMFMVTLPASSIATFSYTASNATPYPASEVVALRAVNGRYVTNPGSTALVPNSTSIGDAQKFRMYYKPDGFVTLRSLLATPDNEYGNYVQVGLNGNAVAASPTASTQLGPVPNSHVPNSLLSWERFELATNADGSVSFKALVNGKYLQASLGSGTIKAAGSAIGEWEKFVKLPQP